MGTFQTHSLRERQSKYPEGADSVSDSLHFDYGNKNHPTSDENHLPLQK